MKKLYRKGQIVRHDKGPTALMRIGSISAPHGNSIARYYGQSCMGGTVGAYHGDIKVASPVDLKTWKENASWRRSTKPVKKGDLPTPRTDTERLDWLTRSTAYVAHSLDGDCCWLIWPYGKDETEGEMKRQAGAFGSTREAIDAAMEAK